MIIANPQQRPGQRRFFRKGSRPEKSQAVAELAILGALILLGFGAILAYGQMMNSQQSLQMKAFRKALDIANSRNKDKKQGYVVSYTIVKDSPTIDIKDLFGRPDTSRQVASSTVFAVRKDPLFPDLEDEDDRDSVEYYEINGQRQKVKPIKIRLKYDDGNDYETWIAAPIRDVEYSTQKARQGQLNKTENGSSISTTRSGSVTAQDTTTPILESQEAFRINYLADANDEVEQEPWEKRAKMEKLSYTLANWVAFTATVWIASFLCESPGGSCGSVCASCRPVKTTLYGAATAIVSALFSYFLGNEVASGTVEDIKIIKGYRASDSLTGTGSFSIPSETFTIPH